MTLALFPRSRRPAVAPFIAAALWAASLVFVQEPVSAAPAAPVAPVGPVSWLAAGDSYSSGEGIPGTGRTDPCARSRKAFGPAAADILHRQRQWQIRPLSFPACTGAKIEEFFHGRKRPRKPAEARPAQWTEALKTGAPGHRFDVITMSFGGNDVDFADILAGCMPPVTPAQTWEQLIGASNGDQFCRDRDGGRRTLGDLKALIDQQSAGRPDDRANPGFARFYAQVAGGLTDRGILVVVGYPRLFAPSDSWGEWRGGHCSLITAADADMLGGAAEYLEDKQRAAVEEARRLVGHQRIEFVSRLDLFAEAGGRSHELCSGNTDWINSLAVLPNNGGFRVSHAFHPNEVGHQATAEVVAGVVDATVLRPAPPPAEPAKPLPPEPTQAPIEDEGANGWDPGDRFEARCVVAWPSAPTRTSSTISMTMSCDGVPRQFLFVNVTYPDPDLPITPSTGQVGVRGVITDIAHNELGFRTLLVAADGIDLG